MSPLAALLIGWVLTAFWPIIAKEGMRLYTGVLFAQAGQLVGLLCVAPWLVRGGRWRLIFSPRLRRPFFFLGLFGSGIPSFLLITALEYTTPANAAIMAQVEVLYSAALCSWLLRERIALGQAAGSLLVISGTGLILGHDIASGGWKGDLIILLTPWMFQLSHIISKRLPPDLDAVTITGARLLYGTLALLPFSAWALLRDPRWAWTPPGAGLLLAQGLGMCSLNHILWYTAIRRMDLAKATAIMLSYPALTVLFSWGLGREEVRAFQLLGLGLTLAGASWVSRLVLRAGAPAPAETSPLAPAGG